MVGGGHGSPGNSDGGNNSGGRGGPGGGRGGATGGGRGRSGNGATGGPGRDTPGSPNAADGKRGSTMGPEGGVAPDSGNRDGSQTPGSPDNPGRRGAVAGEGISARESARRARSSLARQGHATTNVNGIGKSYSLSKELQKETEFGVLSPREMDMRIGIEDGRNAQIGAQVAGMMTSLSPLSSVPGLTSLTSTAAEEGMREAPRTPETDYGAAHARQHTQNTAAQNAAQALAGATLGPFGSTAVGAANISINDARSREALGIDAPDQAPSNPTAGNSTGGGGATTPSVTASTANARASMQPRPPATNAAPTFNKDSHSKGLLSLAQSFQ